LVAEKFQNATKIKVLSFSVGNPGLISFSAIIAHYAGYQCG